MADQWVLDLVKAVQNGGGPHICTSSKPYMSPVDGSMIHNSKDLREHNARNNVIDTGTEYHNHRDEYIEKTEIDESVVLEADYINQAVEEITNA